MKQYTKTIDGKTVIKTRNQIVVVANGRQHINPTEEILLADGWVEYIIPERTEEQKARIALARARSVKKNEINSYDKSTEVNQFFVNGLSVWLDKATRAGLLLRFQAEAAQGLVSTSLWYNGAQFPLKVDQAIQMLYAIELYASACYDNTQKHLAAINALQTIEEIEQYDNKVGYPEQLSF